MYNYMKTILSAVKFYIDKIAGKIPTKISDLEMDIEVGGTSSWDNLKDRPFGSEYISTEYLPKTTIEFNYDSDEAVYYKYLDGKVTHLLDTEKIYSVVINDVVYEEVLCVQEEDDDYATLGSRSETDFNRYPFHIHSTGKDSLMMSLSKELCESTSTHTIEIIEINENITKVDAKYLPDLTNHTHDYPDLPFHSFEEEWNVKTWAVSLEEIEWEDSDDTGHYWRGSIYAFFESMSIHNFYQYDVFINEYEYKNVKVSDEGYYEDIDGDCSYLGCNLYNIKFNDYDDRPPFSINDWGYIYIAPDLYDMLATTEIMVRIRVYKTLHKTIDDIYIPDTIARKEEIPEIVQSDMNDMDEDSPAFIKNKTHWYENSPYDYLLLDDDGNVYVQFTSETNVWVKLPYISYFDMDGELLTVVFDGIEYRLPVIEKWGDEDPYYILKNDKFEIKYDFYDDNMYVKTIESGEHKINIYRGGEHWNTLDERFIPDTIARIPLTVTFSGNEFDGYSSSHTFDEIYQAIQDGKDVVGQASMDSLSYPFENSEIGAPSILYGEKFTLLSTMDVAIFEHTNFNSNGYANYYVYVNPEGMFVDFSEFDTRSKITSPYTAEVGQIIVVKSVDENGKPTEWECVDMPSGGNSDINFYNINNVPFSPISAIGTENSSGQILTVDLGEMISSGKYTSGFLYNFINDKGYGSIIFKQNGTSNIVTNSSEISIKMNFDDTTSLVFVYYQRGFITFDTIDGVTEKKHNSYGTIGSEGNVYTKTEIDSMFATYITEVAELVGGEA